MGKRSVVVAISIIYTRSSATYTIGIAPLAELGVPHGRIVRVLGHDLGSLWQSFALGRCQSRVVQHDMLLKPNT